MTFSSEDDWAWVVPEGASGVRVIHDCSKSSSESEKVNFSLVTHRTFLISAGIGPFFAWKVNGRSYISSRHIVGGKVLFLPLLQENSLDAWKVRFSIHFSTQKKGLFHARLKKIFIFSDTNIFMKNLFLEFQFNKRKR